MEELASEDDWRSPVVFVDGLSEAFFSVLVINGGGWDLVLAIDALR